MPNGRTGQGGRGTENGGSIDDDNFKDKLAAARDLLHAHDGRQIRFNLDDGGGEDGDNLSFAGGGNRQ